MNTTKYHKSETYEQKIRRTLSLNEAIRRIKESGGVYDPHFQGLDAWDQFMICKGLEQSQRDYKNWAIENNVSVNGNDSDNVPQKRQANIWLTDEKRRIITEIKQLNHRSSRRLLESLLCQLFQEWPSKPGHWLYVAQHWNPKSISACLGQMVHETDYGIKTYFSPARYFTDIIKWRKKRKNI